MLATSSSTRTRSDHEAHDSHANADGAQLTGFSIALVAIAAIVSGGLVWWATGPWGPGLSPDAVAYTAIAERMRDHAEIGYWLEPSASSWPPLFPGLLAAVSTLFDISVVDAGRLVNVLAQGLTVVVVALLARRLFSDVWLLAVAVVTAAVAQPLTYVAVKVWSEPVFNLLVLCLALTIAGVPGTRPHVRLLGASAIAVAGFSTRYAGLAFVAATVVVLLLWPRERTTSARARAAAWFGAPAGLAALAMVVWNRARTGEAFGPRWRPDEPFWNHISDGLVAIGSWFLPTGSQRALAILFGVGIVIAASLALILVWRFDSASHATKHGESIGVTAVLVVFMAAYFAYMVWARTTSGFDPLNGRLMLPVFVPAVLLVLALVNRLAAALSGPGRLVVLALPALLVAPTVLNGLDVVRDSHESGNEYTSGAVREFVASAVVDEIPEDCAVLTNDPWLLWLTGREAQLTPQQNREVAIPQSMELAELPGMVAERPTCLVWLDTGSTIFFAPAELGAVVDLDEVASDEFTTVYRLSPRG